ncbi:MAG TPA: penicillin acylase family protein, partial [Dehalococcoidia bacterium]|nr:penicillin acylase family protein [Dehalococcoidia bacterium]
DAAATPVLAAYCSGVNAFLRGHRDRLPLEFSLLRFRPEPWSPVDSLTWAKLMGWSLSLNWDVELFRARFIVDLGPEAASQLEIPYPGGHPLTTPVGGAESGPSDDSSEEYRALGGMLRGGFSNAWVVSGQRSETGKPLLASDPHLIPQLPSPWYEMHLECPEFRVAGATLPGAPGTVIGHNERIAWGMTAGMADTQDLYMEEFSQEEPHKYRHKGRWRTATVVQERIRVKGQLRPETEEVLATLHGPVLFPAKEGPRKAFALRSALLEPNQLLKAGLGLAKAKDWDDFRAALADWAAPAVNFLYADVAGNIGYQFAGRVPRRARSSGLVPVPGWTGDHEWQGYLAQSELPYAYNPPEGYLVNANNKPAGGAGATPIAGEWIDGYRAQRIQDLILAKGVLSREDFRAMHMDVLSLPALELKKLLKRVRLGSPQAQRALETLMQWDGRVTAESRGAAVYEAFRLRLLRNLLSPLLGSRTDDYFEMQLHPLASTSVYQFRGASFFLERLRQLMDGRRGPGTPLQDPGEVLARSLEEATADLRRRLGGDESRWSWGHLHRVAFRHVLGQGPV